MARKLRVKINQVKFEGRCKATINLVDPWTSKNGNECLIVRMTAHTPEGNVPVTGWVKLDSPVLNLFLLACDMPVREGELDLDLDEFTDKEVEVQLTWNEEYNTHNVQRWYRSTKAGQDMGAVSDEELVSETEEEDEDIEVEVEESVDEIIPFI